MDEVTSNHVFLSMSILKDLPYFFNCVAWMILWIVTKFSLLSSMKMNILINSLVHVCTSVRQMPRNGISAMNIYMYIHFTIG